MAAQATTEAELAEALRAIAEAGGNKAAAARALGIPRTTLRHRIKAEPAKPFDVAELPSELPTAAELLERRSKQFQRKLTAKDARSLVPVTVHLDGPIGIMHMGDPHVDDDGTDIDALQQHVAICNRTEGLFAANVGDYSNNWVGRLARLYAEQSLSAAEAWVLVEWLIQSTDWLYLIGGNHDLWSGAGDPIKWMTKHARVSYEANGMRLGLTFPNRRVIRVNARHDFSGHSQWNTAHGPSKAAQMGWRDHILVCGHTHVSGYNVNRDPASGLISHSLRVGSYKSLDRYAEERGLPNQTFTVAPVTVIDPEQPDDSAKCVTVFFDPEEGAEYLTFKRKRWARKRA
jgi:transposase-like protein